MNREEVASRIKYDAAIIEEALSDMLSDLDNYCPELVDAMKYSVLGGGKRIRGVLCLEVCKMLGVDIYEALPYACALELMHASSLVHDDMPELDNDDMRRGKPSCHKKYSQSTALLCGDALICLAFDAILKNQVVDCRGAVSVLCDAGGVGGIASGQMLDIASESNEIEYTELLTLQSLKTGRLMRASAVLGAFAAGIDHTDEFLYSHIASYAEKLGLAFQIEDDLLDAEEEGSDTRRGLATFLSFMTADDAKKMAKKLSDEAKEHIAKYEENDFLCGLCDYLLEREY